MTSRSANSFIHFRFAASRDSSLLSTDEVPEGDGQGIRKEVPLSLADDQGKNYGLMTASTIAPVGSFYTLSCGTCKSLAQGPASSGPRSGVHAGVVGFLLAQLGCLAKSFSFWCMLKGSPRIAPSWKWVRDDDPIFTTASMYKVSPLFNWGAGHQHFAYVWLYHGDDRIANFTLQLQQFAKEAGHDQPLTIGLKEAGGLYDHLPFTLGRQFPYPLSLAAGHSTATTFQIGQAIGKELASIGLNWVLTPTLDLLSDSTEPLDVSQTFGSNPAIATEHAMALIQGLATEGVSACPNAHPVRPLLEVFQTQSSTELAEDVQDLSQTSPFVPLATFFAAHPHDSMQFGASIHDFPEPEQSAHAIRTTCELILRNKCRYQGPTVSSLAEPSEDSSVCEKHSPLLTMLSGLDMIKLPKDPEAQQESIKIMEVAMMECTLTARLIPASAARVAKFKSQFLTWGKALSPRQLESLLQPTHNTLVQQTHQASITPITLGPSPLQGLSPTSVLLLLTPSVPRRHPNSPSDPFEPLGRALSASFSRLRHVPYTLSAGLTDVHRPFLQRATAIILVLCNISSALVESQDEVVSAVQNTLRARDAMPGQQRTRKVVIGAGDPRDLRDDFPGWWGVCCYDYSRGALEAVAEVVLGQREGTGILPA
ncbi:MAG: hypothetical protein Q9218_001560 [Villophora microphyllina]